MTSSFPRTFFPGSIAPVAVWFLRLAGEYDDKSGLISASEVIRYIFTLFPAFPFARSVMALSQV